MSNHYGINRPEASHFIISVSEMMATSKLNVFNMIYNYNAKFQKYDAFYEDYSSYQN